MAKNIKEQSTKELKRKIKIGKVLLIVVGLQLLLPV